MRRTRDLTVALVLTVSLAAAACGGGSGTDSSSEGSAGGEPRYGGKVTYGLEAETSGGWCLPEAQLAIGGMMVARAVYDTLTVPDRDGFAPYLASSVEPDATYTNWTVKLRPGVTFHDGSPLTAQVVKNNLDAYLGNYPGRTGLLFHFVLSNIASVDVVDDTTLTITTHTPWPDLPAYLYGGGRLGIMAQSQLDDPDTCDSKLVGTGPFELEEWVVNDHLSVKRNPKYWAKDDKGRKLPFLDEVVFRPTPDSDSRVNSLISGQFDVIHATAAPNIEALRAEKESGSIDLIESLVNAEQDYIMFNTAHAPFDSATARKAVATALDRDLYKKVRNLDLLPVSSGGFSPGTPGHLDDAGFPAYDPAEARRLVEQYRNETGRPLEVSYVFSGDADSIATAQFVQEQLAKVGITVKLQQLEQAALINTALGDKWDAMPFRNLPGGVADANYVWWYGGSPVNFGKFDDPEVNRLLDEGRSGTDPDERRATYEELNRYLNSQVYVLWLNLTKWVVASRPGVHQVMGPVLPDGSRPTEGLSTGHSLTGMWVDG